MKESEIKPCPFCGGEAELRIASEIWRSCGKVEIGGWKVACKKCEIETALENRDTAIKKWNRRSDNG
jgi:Lar family restriction alleviation protein